MLVSTFNLLVYGLHMQMGMGKLLLVSSIQLLYMVKINLTYRERIFCKANFHSHLCILILTGEYILAHVQKNIHHSHRKWFVLCAPGDTL